MRDIADYEEAYLADYDFERELVRYRRQVVIEALARYPHRRILDVGCGMDPLFAHFSDFDRLDVMEPGARFFENAARLRGTDSRVVLHRGTLEDTAMAIRGEAFDVIVLSGLLHHVSDVDVALEATRSLCRPETRVHINVPNARSLHRVIGMEMGVLPSIESASARGATLQQERVFDLGVVRRLVEKHGFEVVREGTYFLKPFTHRQMADMMRHGSITTAVLDGLFAVSRHYPESGAELYVDLALCSNL